MFDKQDMVNAVESSRNWCRRDDGSYAGKLHVPGWGGEELVVDEDGHANKLGKGKGKGCQNFRLWAELLSPVNRV